MDTESHSVQSSPDKKGHRAESTITLELPHPSDPIPIPISTVTAQDSFIEPNSPPGKYDGLEKIQQTNLDEMALDETECETLDTAPVISGNTGLNEIQSNIPDRTPLVSGNQSITPGPTPLVSENVERMPPLSSNDADTLVYIDPPVSGASMLCPITLVPLRVHSSCLLITGSTYFQKFFSPTYQFRIVKRRGLVGRLPEGIKYVIDLTPPTIEDEAVITIMEMSCPPGVRSWANKKIRWNLPAACVGGADEYEPVDSDEDMATTPEENTGQETAVGGEMMNAGNSKLPLPVEYSPTRHRVAIEQILHVLEGFEVKLDTPCKLWAFFSLANIFEVASTPRICDLILAWFYESTNVRFIDLNPEVTYRVACGIKCSSLCRTAFSILVGEETMLLLAQTGKSETIKRPITTFHRRVRDSLDDTEIQRIEYASKSFMDYIVGRFVYLAGTEMPWIAELEEYQRILNCPTKSESDRSTVSEFVSTLKNFVRGYIYWHFDKTNLTWMPRLLPLEGYDDYPSANFRSLYGEMRYIERLMSRTFWNTLVNNNWLSSEWSRPGRGTTKHSSIAELGEHPALQKETAAKIEYVGNGSMLMITHEFNNLIRMTELAPDAYTQMQLENAHLLDIDTLFSQIKDYIMTFAINIAHPHQAADVADLLTDSLTCLTENEYKFLPLWAGGNDDGTGGVFTDQGIPNMEAGGFSAPGPGINTGSTAPPSDASYAALTRSDYENTEQAASHHATQSHQTDIMSMDSIARSLHDDVNVDGGYDADVPSSGGNTDDDGMSPAFSGGSDNELIYGEGIVDDDGSVTVGERESISDFMSDAEGEALELDLEDGGYEDDNDVEGGDGDDEATAEVEKFI